MNTLTRPALAANWISLAIRYRRQMLLGSALLVRIGLLAPIAWWIGSVCRQLVLQQTPDAPWQFELFGWLELARSADGWVLGACYAGAIALYLAWGFWRAPRVLTVNEQALCFSARGRTKVFATAQICRLRPLSPAAAWIALALPRIRSKLLATPRGLDGWFELRTRKYFWDKTRLFHCADPATVAKLQAFISPVQALETGEAGVPLSRLLLVPALIALLIVLPELTITLMFFYGAWRLIRAILRKRKRKAWERAARRVGQVPAAPVAASRPLALLSRLESFFAALLIFPLRAIMTPLRYLAGWLRLVPWRGLHIALGDGLVFILLWFIALLPAVLIGFALASAESYSQTSPSLARILLARTAHDQLPTVATQALERAMQNGLSEAMRAVLLAGTRQGVFHLSGYQADKRRAQTCRDALPLELAPAKIVLDEAPTEADLIFAARCALNPSHLQLALSSAAYQRQAGAKLDLHRALDGGNVDLLLFVLDQGANLEQRDWRGRTPLLAALDLLAASPPERREPTLQLVFSLVERGANLAVQDNAQRSAALIAAATDLPEILFERMLAATPAQARSTLGATVLHAAAASGDVARARQIVARGTPAAALTADGRNALHFAKGRAMVWYLIDLGLDAELPDARGQTPFHHAVIRRDLAAARVLGGLAANKNNADIFGRSALEYAPERPKVVADESKDKTGSTQSKRKKNEPKPEWLQWRELADLLQGHRL